MLNPLPCSVYPLLVYVHGHFCRLLTFLPIFKGAFTTEVIAAMAAINPRPIIFPLSNPVKLAECTFADAVEHTQGSVLFASGSPFPSQTYNGKVLYPGQGNNMYIFPG
jgi:malate dehydrogenase (oxaloacetate-decarboxylating)(NADP+)